LHIVHRVIVSIRSGKFLFHDWKSQGKVREFYYARPVGTLIKVLEQQVSKFNLLIHILGLILCSLGKIAWLNKKGKRVV